MTCWSDLQPDSKLVDSLDEADAGGSRTEALRSSDQQLKKNWSNRFADACARMVASEVARHQQFSRSEVRPNERTKAEPVTFLVGGKKKKVDVVISSVAVGLQLGISLKGMNFRDAKGLQFDKNLTGRTYELEDEVRVVHRTLPMAFIVALYFLPIASTVDKQSNSTSSFARTVEHLRARVGRTDPRSEAQAGRIDMAAVAIYSPGDEEVLTVRQGNKQAQFEYRDVLPRGVVRYFDVSRDPPRRGRPTLELTSDLPGFVGRVARGYRSFVHGDEIEWSDPEPD